MPKGDACKSPHRIEAGLVCPKFRRAKPHQQPKLLALPAPPLPTAETVHFGMKTIIGFGGHPLDRSPKSTKKPAKAKPMKKAKTASKAKSIRTAALAKAMNTNKLVSDAKVLKAVTRKSKTPPKRKEYLKLKARERRAANKAGLSVQDYRARQATA